MRPKTRRITHLSGALKGLTFCGVFALSAFSLHARYGNPLSGIESTDPLAFIQAQPAAPPRMAPQAETISVRDLLVPAGAIKEFQRSEQAFHSGDFHSAVGHLQKAIQIEPNFVQAHNNLGASYVELKQYESAVTEFQKAIDLDSKVHAPYRNLGLGLFLLRRYPQAELAERQALQLNPQSGLARYTLGRILAAEGGNAPEAEKLLRQFTSTYPEARLPLVRALLDEGALDQAALELRAYLNSADADPAKKQAAQCWLAQITKAQVTAACEETKAAR